MKQNTTMMGSYWTFTLFSLQMSGYVEGLRITARQPEERDTDDGLDSANFDEDQPNTSSSLFIY